MCFRHVKLGGGPWADPGNAGEVGLWLFAGLGILPEELEDVAEEIEVWASLHGLLPRQPAEVDGW